ncbi:hypothetical protein JI743_09990 [Sphingopyxis sp. DHUNG17]|uniref:hypothetical protein n=1 Tax=Sphingopyxis jiangsuensis TaxID=2871171 RepID=UPI00191F62B0|nr:hypothetical protein [Sphingopyxis lutea]MBL0769138.1 hypothetical protein [Sphingopyxis lutea]
MRIIMLALGAWTAVSATPAWAKWQKAETDSFIIYSEGSESSLRSFAETLQRFDITLRILLDVKEQGEPHRLPIYLLGTTGEVAKLFTGSRNSGFAGFYRTGPDGSFAVSHRENDGAGRGTSASQQTLFHEYSHHFMKRYRTAVFPAWLIEGFAEYYSTVDFNKNGKAEVGKPAYRRGYSLLALPQIPVKTLIESDPLSLKSTEQVDVFYGRAWLLTHMLYQDPSRAGQLDAYVRAINAGEDAKDAALNAFGDLDAIDKDLKRYVGRSLSYRLTNAAIPIPANIRITPLSAGEDAIIELRLQRMSAGNDPEKRSAIRDALKVAAAAHPGDAAVWYELAAAERGIDKDQRDAGALRDALDRALAIKPDHVRANVLLGRILTEELDEKGDYDDASWRAARRPIQLANRTDPDDPVPLYAYFRSFVDQGVRPPDIAIQGLGTAFLLAPENIEVRVAYAFALANQGKHDVAIKLAQSIAFDPHMGANGRSLLRSLELMRDGGNGADLEEETIEEASDAEGADQ